MKRLFAAFVIVASLSNFLTACSKSHSSASSVASKTKVPQFNQAYVDKALSEMVENGDVVGASGLIYKDGQEVYFGTFGLADRESKKQWTRDSLVNIYSMTKPVTGVTLMSLYEDGLFALDDPLSKYLPEFADAQVYAGADENGVMILEAPNRPITVRDVMRHTAGFGYGWGNGPVETSMREINLLDPSKPLSQFSKELAELPLQYQPGTQWKYSVSVDVQTRLAEVISGQSYEELVQERVLDPLRMNNTGYFVPAKDKEKVTAIYIRGSDGTLAREPDNQVYGFWKEKPVQINGGHGLVATIDDYMRFARMLLNNGSLDGVQILKPETIALMSKNQLPDGLTDMDFLPGKGQMGFGLDFAVRIAPPIDETENAGEVGEFFWDGRASTLFWVDPKSDLAAVLFVQVVPFDGSLHHRFRRAVYDALFPNEDD